MINIKSAIQAARETLKNHSEQARLEAEVLLKHVLKCSQAYLYTYPEKILSDQDYQHYRTLVAERAAGMPIAYLTGEREFWSLNLKISPDCLIPRPATEKLVELCLQLLKDRPAAKILDLGTGSGAIALALASERPDLKIYACDRSKEALNIAQENAKQLALSNIHFFKSDWFSDVKDHDFDAIISNPPYIAAADPHLLQGDLRFEPQSALVSGQDGLDDIRAIAHQAYAFLQSHGMIVIEHGYDQNLAVSSILKESGYGSVHCVHDDEGQPRVSWASK